MVMGDDYSTKNTFCTALPTSAETHGFNYDLSPQNSEFPQPQTTPIAHFTSSLSSKFHQLIDISTSYIVYAVKNNLVRVIDRRHALRTLLRGHVDSISDISFFRHYGSSSSESSSDVLATVGGSVLQPSGNTIFIWRLYNKKVENNTEIGTEKLLEIRFDDAGWIAWHPFNPNQFLIVVSKEEDCRSSVVIETTKLSTTTDPDERHALCMCRDQDLGNALEIGRGIVDVDWDLQDLGFIVCAKRERCELWSTSEKALVRSVAVPHVSKCKFGGDDGSFLTGAKDNTEITLWSSFLDGDNPKKLQVWNMGHSTSLSSFHLSVCNTLSSTSSYLLLADRNVGNLYAITIQGNKFTAVSPFSVLHPIVSWSVVSTSSVDFSPPSPNAVDLCLFCVQSKAVQMLRLRHNMLLPPEEYDGTLPDHITLITEEDEHVTYDYEQDEVARKDEQDEQEDEEEQEHLPRTSPPAPPATALPPPGLPPPSASAATGAFSNWLGAIASAPSPATAVLPPPPSSTPDTTAKKDLVVPTQLRASPSLSERQAERFLSPMEFLASSSSASPLPSATLDVDTPSAASKPEPEPKEPPTPVIPSEEPEVTQPTPRTTKTDKPTSTNNTKSTKSTPSNNFKKSKNAPQPTPNSPNRTVTAILKRDIDAPSTAAPPIPPPTAPLPPPSDETIRKLLKKQETNLSNEFSRAIKNEIQSMLVPSVTRALTQSMQDTVTKPLQNAIKAKKEDKGRVKEMSDALVEGVKSPIVEAFQQTMREAMIPAFEAATQQMFTQVSTALETNLSNQQTTTADYSRTLNSLSSKMDSMAIALESLSVEVTHLRTLVNTLTEASQAIPQPTPSAVPSTAFEPMPQVTKDDILRLLNKHEYEAAFTKALSASSADLALFACKNADINSVLDGESPHLSQPILLCLMQQLGSVLPSAESSDLMEVLSWLQDICVVLDPSDKSIQRHVGEVLRQLVKNINVKYAEGDLTFRRPLQMLLQVIRGIGNV